MNSNRKDLDSMNTANKAILYLSGLINEAWPVRAGIYAYFNSFFAPIDDNLSEIRATLSEKKRNNANRNECRTILMMLIARYKYENRYRDATIKLLYQFVKVTRIEPLCKDYYERLKFALHGFLSVEDGQSFESSRLVNAQNLYRHLNFSIQDIVFEESVLQLDNNITRAVNNLGVYGDQAEINEVCKAMGYATVARGDQLQQHYDRVISIVKQYIVTENYRLQSIICHFLITQSQFIKSEDKRQIYSIISSGMIGKVYYNIFKLFNVFWDALTIDQRQSTYDYASQCIKYSMPLDWKSLCNRLTEHEILSLLTEIDKQPKTDISMPYNIATILQLCETDDFALLPRNCKALMRNILIRNVWQSIEVGPHINRKEDVYFLALTDYTLAINQLGMHYYIHRLIDILSGSHLCSARRKIAVEALSSILQVVEKSKRYEVIDKLKSKLDAEIRGLNSGGSSVFHALCQLMTKLNDPKESEYVLSLMSLIGIMCLNYKAEFYRFIADTNKLNLSQNVIRHLCLAIVDHIFIDESFSLASPALIKLMSQLEFTEDRKAVLDKINSKFNPLHINYLLARLHDYISVEFFPSVINSLADYLIANKGNEKLHSNMYRYSYFCSPAREALTDMLPFMTIDQMVRLLVGTLNFDLKYREQNPDVSDYSFYIAVYNQLSAQLILQPDPTLHFSVLPSEIREMVVDYATDLNRPRFIR